MNVLYVNPFIEGTLHILDTTAFVKTKPEPCFIKKSKKAYGDISGLLEIAGDLTGTASISFSKESILGVVSAMFGEEMTELNEEITDAVGEISNMVAGHVTTKIGELDKKVKVKLSEVKMGNDHEIDHVESGECVVVIPFKTTKGKLVIEVSFAA